MSLPSHIVSIHRDVSQVDDAVFAAWDAEARGASIDLVFWNDYGLRREQPDPELGLVPRFPPAQDGAGAVRRIWLDRRTHALPELARAVLASGPRLVLVNDLPVRAKFGLAAQLRRGGVRTAFRSDKNRLSQGARRGLGHALERWAHRLAFDAFCPASRLALDYYGWPARKPSALFPYATDPAKFSRPADDGVRQAVRARLGIPAAAPVLLCVAKFVEREGVADVIDAYLDLRRRREGVHLVMVGSGPQAEALQAQAAPAGGDIHFVGYVPFAELEDYFFAADVFVHLARREPWGVSVSDALCAGLGVVATDAVGAGLELLQGPLARYVTPAGDPARAADALDRLLASDCIAEEFRPARELVVSDYSTAATARRLAALGG